jgi:putative mRNA 3-end processing factor
MIEIRFLGGCHEVGRSAFLIDTGVEKFLLDYGMNVQENIGPAKPSVNLDGVFLSHAHLDHSGFLPDLYRSGYSGHVYATPITFDLTSILLRDSIKLQKRRGNPLPFQINDVKRMERFRSFLRPGEVQEFSLSSVEFFHAGHIPGSVSILLDCKGKRILYTGDIKFINTQLMAKASSEFKDIDYVISESTYSYMDHPERKSLEDRLKQIVQETVYNEGIALIPSFAVGRTQELLIILYELGIPLYLDGMGIRATERTLKYPDTVRDPKKLKEAFGRARKVKRMNERDRAIEKPCVIITTAGMLNGGPIVHYIGKLFDRPDCSLTLTGYQVSETAGRKLLDTGKYSNGEIEVKPRMRIEFLDFSAHTDHQHLLEFFNKVNPEKIFLVHGDHISEFEKELKELDFDACGPKNGGRIRV